MDSKTYRSIPAEVTAVPMIEHDYIMSREYIPGTSPMMKDGYRKGYKITDEQGKVTWMAKDEFDKTFVEVDDNG
jgi:hypothetical protein